MAFSFTRGSREDVARIKRVHNIVIELITIETLLANQSKDVMTPMSLEPKIYRAKPVAESLF